MPEMPEEQAQAQAQGPDLMTKMDAVGKALAMIQQEMGDSPLGEEMGQVLAAYASIFDKVSGGGAEAPVVDMPTQQGPGGMPMGPQTRN